MHLLSPKYEYISESDTKIIISYPIRIYNPFLKEGEGVKIDYSAIGVRIRRQRREKKWTQEKLAELSGVEPSNISHIERGTTKLSLPTIVNIANALGVTVDSLLCDSLPAAENMYIKEASSLLFGCTHQEQIIITETMRTLREQLKKHGGT